MLSRENFLAIGARSEGVDVRPSATTSNREQFAVFCPTLSFSILMQSADTRSEFAVPESTLCSSRNCVGAPFLKIWRNTDQPRINAILQTAADHEAPCLLLAEACPAGGAPIEIEVTLLPLRHQGATHARMLGSLSVRGVFDWLGLIASGPTTLKAWSGLEPGMIEQRHIPQAVRLAREGATAQLVRGV